MNMGQHHQIDIFGPESLGIQCLKHQWHRVRGGGVDERHPAALDHQVDGVQARTVKA